ncbi:hypothetical protein TNCV_4228661 [Trichonephila clavipes]|nr:hypothetical protein TNCV_4228661 [Trichonephila clavipes]
MFDGQQSNGRGCRHSTRQQTRSNGPSGHRMMPGRLNLLCYGSRCGCVVHYCHAHNLPVITGRGATRWVRLAPFVRRFLLHPAMAEMYHMCLVSSNTLTNFSEGGISIGYYSSSVEFRTLVKKTLDIFHEA